jgi:beta-lactamase class A
MLRSRVVHLFPGTLFLGMLVCAGFTPAAAWVPPDSIGVNDSLRTLEARYGGHLGMMAVNLHTGEELRYNAAEQFPTASVIKLAVMSAYFDAVHKGLLDPDESVRLRGEDMKPGSGVLQFMSPGEPLTLRDVMTLMIILSDNTATNLLLDRLGSSVAEQLDRVNRTVQTFGLTKTRLLNRLFSWQTKQNSPEGIRYGIGVSTPEDMVTFMAALYRRQLVDEPSSEEMVKVLALQQDNKMIPRYLPVDGPSHLRIAHKTGSITETKADVGLVLSDSTAFAIAIFVDKSPDHSEGVGNSALELGGQVARFVWHRWSTAAENRPPVYDVDWTEIPGGQWGIYRSHVAPFPSPQRAQGFFGPDSTFYPYFPHYADSSIVVFVPDSLRPIDGAVNAIVHFHGHGHDNLDILEHAGMIPALLNEHINAVLVLPQGPYRARDSFGGKMEDPGGLQRMLEDVIRMLAFEEVVPTPVKLGRLIVSAHSGGYRPAAYCVERGGVLDHLDDVFLFDALYGYIDVFDGWLEHSRGHLFAAFTEHLRKAHETLLAGLSPEARQRAIVGPASVDHEHVVPEFFPRWIHTLPPSWRWQGERTNR